MSATVLIPSREDLAAKLAAVGITPETIPKGLYAAFLSVAGQEMTGARLGSFLAATVRNHLDDTPFAAHTDEERATISAASIVLRVTLLPDLILAVVDDAQITTEALTALS
ncbi:hypothetical protein [Streptomyces phaeochromogenes]